MASEEKCHQLAVEIRKILGNSITLGSQLVHYIDSTFSNPTTTELQTILQDDSNCEKDSLMQLLLFPDETIQLQLEALLERLQLKAEDEKSVLLDLLKIPLQVTIRFPRDSEALHLTVTEEAAEPFISRLNISKHLNPGLLAILNRHDDKNISNRIKVKIRNARFFPSEEKIKFLCLFFETFDSQDNDILECLDFVVALLDELNPFNDAYQSLMAKKKFYFISLQKAKQLETQLHKHNVETLLAQGKRVVLIDQEDARKKMLIIDRISRALFGKTKYFEPLNGNEEYLEISPDQNVKDFIRTLS